MSKDYNLFKSVKQIFTYNKVIVLLAVFLSLLVTGAIWALSKKYYDHIAFEKFESAVNENIDMIDGRMSKYKNILQSGIGFFHGSDNVTRQEWHDFITALNIEENYPGMQGIGFSKMIHPDEVESIEQGMRKEGFASFSIRPLGEREEYSSILYLEPMDERNLLAIGYDMFSEPKRRLAMETARDTGLPSISEKVTLVQEVDEEIQPGILMYLPLYKKGAKTESVEERRKALIGFVYSPFRMNDAMNKIVLDKSILNFKIYDGEDISEENLLYKSFEPSSSTPKHNIKKTLKVTNRLWHIYFSSTKKFENSTDTLYPLLMTSAGLIVQFFLLFIILMLFNSRYLLKLQAKELTKLSQAVEQSPSTIVITDLYGKVEYANEAFTKTTGYTKDEAIGKNPRFLKSGKTEVKVYSDMWAHLTAGETWHGEFINLTKDGDEYIEEVKVSPIFQEDGTISNYVAIKEDITDKKHSEERIHFLANFDSLTGLPNRFQLDERIKYAISIAKRDNESFSIMFLDLDHFKEINDTLGHDAGDALLIEMARRFKSVLREVDMVSRLGGDEFIFLLPNTNASGASNLAEKLLKIIEVPCKFNTNDLLVTGSIGIAIYPIDGLTQETLFKNADDAMYDAKHDGRNKYCFFTKKED